MLGLNPLIDKGCFKMVITQAIHGQKMAPSMLWHALIVTNYNPRLAALYLFTSNPLNV